MEPKFHPLDVILSLLRYKRWLVICPLIAAVIAFAFVSQLPRYSAMARLLPPKTKTNTATMLSQTGSLAGAGVGGVLEGKSPWWTCIWRFYKAGPRQNSWTAI